MENLPAAFLALMLIISDGCVSGRPLEAYQVQKIAETAGLYSLILYHEAQYGGLKSLAFSCS